MHLRRGEIIDNKRGCKSRAEFVFTVSLLVVALQYVGLTSDSSSSSGEVEGGGRDAGGSESVYRLTGPYNDVWSVACPGERASM